MDAHRDRLLARPGVVGVGIGFRRRDERLVQERCVIVYVDRKRTGDELSVDRRGAAVPRTLSVPDARRPGRFSSRRVPVDVVELGTFEHRLDAGVSIGLAGTQSWGTITVYATDAGGADVALTAMHVTGRDEYPPGPAIAFHAPASGVPFGTLLQGSRRGIDGAKIALVTGVTGSSNIVGIGRVRGWRPVSAEGDRGAYVRMFGAATNRVTYGRIIEPVVSLPHAPYRLQTAILVDIHSSPGDSGAAIVDNDGFVLGLLCGHASGLGGLTVCCPIGNVLYVLGCDIPSA
jgi:hypothetical protein